MSRDNAIVLDMLKSVKLAKEFVGGVDKGFRNAHPDIPWKSVAGMREVRASIERGLADADAGRLIPQEEIEKHFGIAR